MAEETTTAAPAVTEQTSSEGKVYDLSSGKWIDSPAGVEMNGAPLPQKPVEPLVSTSTTEKTEAEKKAEADKAAAAQIVTQQVGFDKTKYSKYGIEKEEDIYKTLDSLDTLQKTNEELRKRADATQHESETHKKLFDFLKPYPESSWQEVLKTGAEIVGMNPDEADGMKLLKEAFVINHPMVSRSQAEFLFNQQEAKKYTLLKKKEEYEDPMQYEIDKQTIEIQTSIAVDNARKVVKETKAKLMTAPRADKPLSVQVPQETISTYGREIEKVMDGTTKGSGLVYLDKNFIRVKSDEKGEPLINIEFPEDKMKELRETALEHIKNPGIYDKSGKIANFDPAKDMLKLASALWPEWIFGQMVKQVDTLASIKKAEQIASVQPDKVETTQGKDIKTMSHSEQFQVLAAKEKEAREKQPPRR